MSDGVRFVFAGMLSVIAIILIVGLIIILMPLLLLGIIGAAFTTLGFSWLSAIAVVLLMLFGSYVNIPIYNVKYNVIRIIPNVSVGFSSDSPWPADPLWESIVSVNLGGAVLPVCISFYLLYQAAPITSTFHVVLVGIGVLIVALITFFSTRPLPGVGLGVPLFIPALTALLMGMFLSGGAGISATSIAFVSGTIGTLVGGNIAWLNRIKELEISAVSVGGAGTFGAIFICCILPAIIA